MKKNFGSTIPLIIFVVFVALLALTFAPMKEKPATIDGESISLAGGSPLILRVANREFFIHEESGNLVAMPPPAPQSMINLKTVDVDGKLEPVLVYELVGSGKKIYRIVKKSTRDGLNIVLQLVPPR